MISTKIISITCNGKLFEVTISRTAPAADKLLLACTYYLVLVKDLSACTLMLFKRP